MSPKVLSHGYHDSPVRSKSGLSHKLYLFTVRRDSFQDRHQEFYSPIPPLLSAPKTDGISSVMTMNRVLLTWPAWDRTQEHLVPDLQWSRGSTGHSWNCPLQVLLKWQTPNQILGLYKAFFSSLEEKWEAVMVHWNQTQLRSRPEVWCSWWIPNWPNHSRERMDSPNLLTTSRSKLKAFPKKCISAQLLRVNTGKMWWNPHCNPKIWAHRLLHLRSTFRWVELSITNAGISWDGTQFTDWDKHRDGWIQKCPAGLILPLQNSLYAEYLPIKPYPSSHLWDQDLSIYKKALEIWTCLMLRSWACCSHLSLWLPK